MPTSNVVHLPSLPALTWDDCRLLVESVVDYAIFMLDANGHVATWNLGAEKIKGYRAEEIVGKHFSQFFTDEDVRAGKPQRGLEKAQETGRFEDESWRVRKDGSRFWANVVITALRDEHGKLRGFGKVTRDLTLRKQVEETERQLVREQGRREAAEAAERTLREREQRFRALSERLEVVLEGVADGITVQDQTGRVVLANTAAARLCGFDSCDELLDTPPADVIARFEILDEQGAPFNFKDLPGRRVLAGEKVATALVNVRHRQSRQDWWTVIRAAAVPALDGTHQLAVNIWHDVTRERRQERQAKFLADATSALGASLQSEEMLSALGGVLVPGLADWCVIHVYDGEKLKPGVAAHADPTKLRIAEEYQRRFQPDPDQPRGVWNVLRTGLSEVYNDITDEMLAATTTDAARLAVLRSAGMKAAIIVPVRVRERVLGALTLVSAESGKRFDPADVALAEELGRRAGVALENVHLYEAAQRAATAAEDASRAKDEFLATVSHELRTPLNAIVGWSAILKDRVKDDALTKPIEVIHRNAQAQVKIIDDILDVSRVITGNFRIDARPVDLVAIAKDAIDVVRPSAAAKKITIHFTPTSDFCLMVADPERLQQVAWNLLSNAVKFTEQGGDVRVSVGHEGHKVLLTISDTGRGIDPAFLPHVFERFRQADSTTTRRVGGLGLGLALVRHIVELHGGRVVAESEGLGRGATFTISLPVRAIIPPHPESPPSPRVHTSASAEGSLQGVRVLVVDDEADARDMIAEVLRNVGAVVETARSAADGLERFRLAPPDVLVSDIGMPDEDGYSFMRRIRSLTVSEGARVPSLALTAFTRAEDRTRSLAAGYTTHVGKPVDPNALVSAVANLAYLNRST